MSGGGISDRLWSMDDKAALVDAAALVPGEHSPYKKRRSQVRFQSELPGVILRGEGHQLSYFDTYGPLNLSRTDGAFTGHQNAFWRDVEVRYEGLSSSIGCYMFCLEYRGVIKPWYVGRTWAEKGFAGEVFQKHKRDIYNNVLLTRRGDPMLFLFPLMTPETYYFSAARKSSKKVISWLETTLMGFAFRKNSEISNVKDMTFLRNVEVLGLLGQKRKGRPFREAQAVRRALLGNANSGKN